MATYNELTKKLNNYSNIRSLVNLNFLQILGQFKVLNENLQNQITEASKLKSTYEAVRNEYQIKSAFFDGFYSDKKSAKQSRLFIYIAEKAKYSAVSFHSTDDFLNNQLHSDDLLVTMGDYADEFATKYRYPKYLHFEKIDEAHTEQIKVLAYELYTSKRISEFILVFPSNNLDNNSLTVLPVGKNKLTKYQAKIDVSKTTIYPTLNDFMSNLNLIYLNYTVSAAIIDASFYSLKQKIIRLKSLLESIEEKVDRIKTDLLKEKRKTLTEDIVITTQ